MDWNNGRITCKRPVEADVREAWGTHFLSVKPAEKEKRILNLDEALKSD